MHKASSYDFGAFQPRQMARCNRRDILYVCPQDKSNVDDFNRPEIVIASQEIGWKIKNKKFCGKSLLRNQTSMTSIFERFFYSIFSWFFCEAIHRLRTCTKQVPSMSVRFDKIRRWWYIYLPKVIASQEIGWKIKKEKFCEKSLLRKQMSMTSIFERFFLFYFLVDFLRSNS